MARPQGLITEHFGWREATRTDQRDPSTGLLLENEPGPEEGRRLIATCQRMEEVRALFGRPIHVHSMYRSPRVNAQVGGSPSSQHMRGEACDFDVDGWGVEEAFEAIRTSLIPYDQLIEEAASWVHVSFISYGAPRREALRMRVVGGRARYEEVH